MRVTKRLGSGRIIVPDRTIVIPVCRAGDQTDSECIAGVTMVIAQERAIRLRIRSGASVKPGTALLARAQRDAEQLQPATVLVLRRIEG